MNVFTIDLPVTDNDGAALTIELAHVQRDILRITGGLTENSGRGQWLDDDGKLYVDEVLTVRTYCNDAQLADLVDRVDAWRVMLRQQALVYAAWRAGVEFVSE